MGKGSHGAGSTKLSLHLSCCISFKDSLVLTVRVGPEARAGALLPYKEGMWPFFDVIMVWNLSI